MSLIRILVVDDFKDWRRQVRLLLQARPRMASHRRSVGWIRSRSEGRRTEAGFDCAGHRSPEFEWNRSCPADTTTLPQLQNIFLSQNNDLDVVRAALARARWVTFIRQMPEANYCLPWMRFLRGKQFVSSSLKGHQFTDTSAEKAPHRHEVLFYSDDAVLLDSVTHFIAVALKAGNAAIVLATKSHRDSLSSEIEGRGVDIDGALHRAPTFHWMLPTRSQQSW